MGARGPQVWHAPRKRCRPMKGCKPPQQRWRGAQGYGGLRPGHSWLAQSWHTGSTFREGLTRTCRCPQQLLFALSRQAMPCRGAKSRGSSPALPRGWEQKAVFQPKLRSPGYSLLPVQCHWKCGVTCNEEDEVLVSPHSRRSVVGVGTGAARNSCGTSPSALSAQSP